MANVWSIVVAGGLGQRFGAPKQFSKLGDRPVLHRAVQACRNVSTGVVLVVPDELLEIQQRVVDSAKADKVVLGGSTRARSVRCGLKAVPPEAEFIVVHDAARPLATPALFKGVLAAVTEGTAAGAVPGIPVRDTIKQTEIGPLRATRKVVATPDRRSLVAVQTPQAFRADALRSAHHRLPSDEATDDASLVEAMGETVVVVWGETTNIKITAPDDLLRAERYLVQLERGGD